ncbi:MAG TPA: glycoside hydrolase family 36 protein [Bryobacteraceae bacterium]|nr:glycoside hydrolase family 36 protein [Bryobacteraceae bacterium]
MRRVRGALVLLAAAGCCATTAPAQERLALQAHGWTVMEDPASHSLRLIQDRLGEVLRHVRLVVDGAPVTGAWEVVAPAPGRISLRVANPKSAWEIAVTDEEVTFSTTSYEAALEAEAPAPASRIVARLLDPQGAPVVWQGTGEVQHGYGGSLTQNPSFLPQKNPDVMYFSLGQVSGGQFHALFDRATDTGIAFPDGASLERDRRDLNLLLLHLPVPGNATLRILPDYFTRTLGVPFYSPMDDSFFRTAPMVWSSWTSYYEDVTEQDIVKNADWLAANLKPYGFEYVQLDDGYDRDAAGQHTWIGTWDKNKFPHGPEWLTRYIRDKGLKAGLWLVPNAYAGAVREHPDWYVRDRDGKHILDYATPALDSTNPEVLTFLKRLFETLDGWGFDYYKFDGEHAFGKYVPAVDRTRLHDPDADLLQNYRRRLQAIRDTLGPTRFIEGCPAGTPLNGIGFFNSIFNGDDLYNTWQGMYPLFSSINANAFLNHLAIYVMPGEGLELGEPMPVEEAARKRPPVVLATAREREKPVTQFGTTLDEARTLVTYVSLTGVAFPLASVMPELPPSRVELLKKTMPTLPVLPADLFSRGTDMTWDKFMHTTQDYYVHNYPELLDLKVNGALGTYDVVGVTNWRSQARDQTVRLKEKLGLPAQGSYVAFDFWNEQLVPVTGGELRVRVQPHETRAILLHRDEGHPQVVGESRHLTGAVGIRDVLWDAKQNRLSGLAQGVAGDLFEIWIYVPDGTKFLSAAGATDMAPTQSGRLLTLAFRSKEAPVRWSVEFQAAR